MADKQMHLTELFSTGRLVTLTYPSSESEDDYEFKVWMRRPTPAQHDQAMAKARAKQARKRREYRDKESDAYLSLEEDVAEYPDRDALLDQIMEFQESTLRQQAYNEVMYDPTIGPDYGKDGSKLLDLITAVQQRWAEINDFNIELSDEDQGLRIKPEEDEELTQLNADQEAFSKEVDERLAVLVQAERETYAGRKSAGLREVLMKRIIDADVSVEWYTEYRTQMCFFSCRYPDDKKRLYFKEPQDILGLPDSIQQQIYNELESLDVTVDQLKK